MSFTRKFKAGDTVFHRPTGETWSLIRDEQDGWVYPGGSPQSQGRSEDCKLVESEEHRVALIRDDVFNPNETDLQYFERRKRQLGFKPSP